MDDVERLRGLIDRYWNIAYAEGKEGRDHDTACGDAQRCRDDIERALGRLSHSSGVKVKEAVAEWPEIEEGVHDILADYRKFISDRPALLSLLYDIDMLPEQCVTRAGAVRLAGLCEVWRRGESGELSSIAPAEAGVEGDAKPVAWRWPHPLWPKVHFQYGTTDPGEVSGKEPLYTHPSLLEEAREDAKLFDALRDESWDLRCFDVPTGGDDADIGWRVIGHWQAAPHERTVAEIYHDDPRAAIRAALAAERSVR